MSRTITTGAITGLALAMLASCGPSIAARVDDGVITTRVRTALLYDTALAVRRLTVVTVDGVVSLSGVVGSVEEAQRAVELARGVAGVRDVRSQLTIRSPGRPHQRPAPSA